MKAAVYGIDVWSLQVTIYKSTWKECGNNVTLFAIWRTDWRINAAHYVYVSAGSTRMTDKVGDDRTSKWYSQLHPHSWTTNLLLKFFLFLFSLTLSLQNSQVYRYRISPVLHLVSWFQWFCYSYAGRVIESAWMKNGIVFVSTNLFGICFYCLSGV